MKEKSIANIPKKIPKNNGPVEKPVVPLTNSDQGPNNKFPEKRLCFVSPLKRPCLTYSTISCLKPIHTVKPLT